MPKIRALKPAFFTDEAVVEVCPLARLLFAGLWCWACDNGHLEDKPRQIKLRILPADDCNVDALLGDLVAQGLIIRAAGWITIPTLTGHQRPDRRYFVRCAFPGCSETDAAEEATKAARFGNHRRWHEARRIVDPACEFCPSEPIVDDGPPEEPPSGPHRVPIVDTTSPRREHDVTPSGPHRDHVPDGDGDGDGDGDSDVAPKGAPQSRKRPARPLPADWQPSDANLRYADAQGLDVEHEAAQFASHHQARDSRFADWHAAFRLWLGNSAKWAKPTTDRRPSDDSWDHLKRDPDEVE